MKQLLSQRISNARPSFIREVLKVAGNPGIISFAGGLPNPALFPIAALKQASAAVLDEEGGAALQYASTEGHADLRRWIAERYRTTQNLDIDPEQILITNGSQQALDLIGKVLLDAGDGVVIEEPGYLGAIQALTLYQPHFLPVALDDEGMNGDALRQTLDGGRPKLLYAVPNFQNPSGISYSEARRREVAALLEGREILLIEDNPYGELRFAGAEATSFHALLPRQTLLLGSFSKIVAPSLRLGWIVAPQWLLQKLVIAKQAADLHTNGFSQRLLHRYLRDNDIGQHIATITAVYGRQKEAMQQAIARHFPAGVRTTTPQGGMFLWAELPPQLSALRLFEAALANGVAFVPGHPFYVARDDSTALRLNYTNADAATIDDGIRRLGAAMKTLLS